MAKKNVDDKPVRETNVMFAEKNENFKKMCENAQIPSTKRQASKFRMGKGKAFKSCNSKKEV